MARIEYDPVKDRFAGMIRGSRVLRRLFYFLLDLFFLRSWHIRRVLRRKCRRLDADGEWRCLDAGCGFGQYDRFLLSEFGNAVVTALDVKQEYVEDCRSYFRREESRGRIGFKVADLLELDRAEAFDVILCVDVLEHIEEDEEVLMRLSRALKPGGFLLTHTPSAYSAADAGEEESFTREQADADEVTETGREVDAGGMPETGREADSGGVADADKVVSFTGEHARAGYLKEELQEKFERAGLGAEELHYTYGRFGHAGWVLSIKYPMLLLNKMGMAGLIPLAVYYVPVLPVALCLNLAELFTKNERGNGIYAVGRKA